MPFGRNTNTHTATLLLILALPIFVRAEMTVGTLQEARANFDEVWHSAASTTQKRSELETTLQQYDKTVEKAKKDLASAREGRKEIRERIAEQKKLIDALSTQIRFVLETRGFYESVLAHHSEQMRAFVRYIAGKDIAYAESGPVAGGSLVRMLARGSLGESIEDRLMHLALLKARKQLLMRLETLALASKTSEDRLHAVAQDLEKELTDLEEDQKTIARREGDASETIDASWRQKKLTEEELTAVSREAAEASARVAEIQSKLIAISEQLKTKKMEAINERLSMLAKEKESMDSKRSVLLAKSEKFQAAYEQMLRAQKNMQDVRNTDRKQYKRTQERENELRMLEALLAKETVEEPDGSVRSMLETEKSKHREEISILKEQISLMEEGIPDDAAREYIDARRLGEDAPKARDKVLQELEDLKPEFALLQERESTLIRELQDAERDSLYGDLPPIFVWPVRGPVTAGFYDTDYEAVFGVAHRAVDIATPQATPVRSISDGIVYTVRDGGATGYSYLLIGHRNGYASLYGHLSSFLVRPGDIVIPGQIIALSGGLPGTHGAGHMTTGAHLHLEITKDGKHVDPLGVLGGK